MGFCKGRLIGKDVFGLEVEEVCPIRGYDVGLQAQSSSEVVVVDHVMIK